MEKKQKNPIKDNTDPVVRGMGDLIDILQADRDKWKVKADMAIAELKNIEKAKVSDFIEDEFALWAKSRVRFTLEKIKEVGGTNE